MGELDAGRSWASGSGCFSRQAARASSSVPRHLTQARTSRSRSRTVAGFGRCRSGLNGPPLAGPGAPALAGRGPSWPAAPLGAVPVPVERPVSPGVPLSGGVGRRPRPTAAALRPNWVRHWQAPQAAGPRPEGRTFGRALARTRGSESDAGRPRGGPPSLNLKLKTKEF